MELLENDFRFELIKNGYVVNDLLNNSLDKVIIPDSSLRLENMLLKNVNLINVILPNNLKVISLGLFNYSGIKRIVIPNSVNRIESIAFYRCER